MCIFKIERSEEALLLRCLTGKMKLYAGGQQPNQKMSVGSNVLETEFTVIQNN